MIYYKGNKLDKDELDFVLSQVIIDLKYVLNSKKEYSINTFKSEVNDELSNYEIEIRKLREDD